MAAVFETIGNQVGALAVEAIKISFIQQGHNLTGNLVNSIRYELEAIPGGIKVLILLEDYGVIVDKSVTAANIPYNPGSGARSSKYIAGLTRFALLRFGVDRREAERIAFAIATKHKKEGMPTRSSFAFSRTGQRTGAISAGVEGVSNEIKKIIVDSLNEAFKAVFKEL